MSVTIVKMVKLSPTMQEGTIVRWFVKEGDKIAAETLLFEVQTDKATMAYSYPDEGFLRQILAPVGTTLALGAPAAVITTKADESFEKELNSLVKTEEKKSPKVEIEEGGKTEPLSTPCRQTVIKSRMAPPVNAPFHYKRFDKTPMKATPHLKSEAEKQNLSLDSLRPVMPDGMLDSEDLAFATSKPMAKLRNIAGYPEQKAGLYELSELSPMRKVIAERLLESKTTIPHFYVSITVNADRLSALRQELQEQNIKVTINDFILRATALSLADRPAMNVAFDPESGKRALFSSVDLSVAVSIPDGLITPIIRHADHKRIEELSAEVRYLAKRAKAGILQPEEYQGGSFTVSNMGMYGIDAFYAIINPPQAAILSVGSLLERPVVKEGKVVPGEVIELGLSVDHRLIDGSVAAEFLAHIKKYIESPSLLII